MSYELIVGLNIISDELYSKYREAMTPILKSFGGGFRYDFKVSEVLKNEEGRSINRVFAIFFKDQLCMKEFFSHPDYLKIKSEFFEGSVGDTTIISQYPRD